MAVPPIHRPMDCRRKMEYDRLTPAQKGGEFNIRHGVLITALTAALHTLRTSIWVAPNTRYHMSIAYWRFMFVVLTGSWSVSFSDHMGHASFVANEGGKMHGFSRVILGECLHLTTMTTGPLLGVESHRTMSRRRKLTMRLEWIINTCRITIHRSFYRIILHFTIVIQEMKQNSLGELLTMSAEAEKWTRNVWQGNLAGLTFAQKCCQ